MNDINILDIDSIKIDYKALFIFKTQIKNKILSLLSIKLLQNLFTSFVKNPHLIPLRKTIIPITNHIVNQTI